MPVVTKESWAKSDVIFGKTSIECLLLMAFATRLMETLWMSSISKKLETPTLS
jgi:hypothetical protein